MKWSSKWSGFAAVIAPRRRRTAKLDDYFQGEFRAYGLCLARANAAADSSRGVPSPDRDEAARLYLAALEDVVAAYDLPDDGGFYSNVSENFPDGPHTRSELVELAEHEADTALLRYCTA